MFLLLLSIIFFTLKQFGVISWADWVVGLPAYILAGWSSWLFIKAEFDYFKSLKKQKEQTEECEAEA